ncbi:MAG: hypothetical protein ABIF09_11990 [Gemmatimonadota bacterium]
MRLFDLATWTAVVILVLGSSAVFIWFLKDAGKILRGDEGHEGTRPGGERCPDGEE